MKMKTATEMHEDDARLRLQKSVEYFIENWSPDDLRDAALSYT
jgi:hypothetical protein